MNKFYFKHKKIDYKNKNYLIFILDTKSEWDAELSGKEPEYEIFVNLITELLFNIKVNYPVLASFTENYSPETKEIIDQKDIKQMINMSKRPNEWIFFYAGKNFVPKWKDYLPFYLIERHKEFFELETFSNSFFIAYHEAYINYLEIISCNLEESFLIKELKKLGMKYNIELVLE